MKIFFDLEFTGLRQSTTLISIGAVSDNGFKFYAETIDYDKSQCDNWIKDNILNKLILNDMKVNTIKFEDETKIKYVKGTREFISKEFDFWLQYINTNYTKDIFEFVSDVCHYDFVLLIDLLTNGKTALDLNKNISPVCYDINQDIIKFYKINGYKAFTLTRENIIKDRIKFIGEESKHNSLWDAIVIKEIYDKLVYNEIEESLELL